MILMRKGCRFSFFFILCYALVMTLVFIPLKASVSSYKPFDLKVRFEILWYFSPILGSFENYGKQNRITTESYTYLDVH